MCSPHSSDNSCSTAAAGFPHLPLQVACLEVVEVTLPAAGLYLVGTPADVSACRSPRRAAGPPHQPLQAACLVVVEVPQPAACVGWVRRPADRCRSPAWPSFNELFLQRYATSKVVDCFQLVPIVSSSKLPSFGVLRYPRFLRNGTPVPLMSQTFPAPKLSHLCHPEACLRYQV